MPDISAAGHAAVDTVEQGVQSADGGEAAVAGTLAVAGVCIISYHSRSPSGGVVVPRRVFAVIAIYPACQTACCGFGGISSGNRYLCIGNAAGYSWDSPDISSRNSSGIVQLVVARGGGNGTVEAAKFNDSTQPSAYTSGSTCTFAIYGDLSHHDKVADRSV